MSKFMKIVLILLTMFLNTIIMSNTMEKISQNDKEEIEKVVTSYLQYDIEGAPIEKYKSIISSDYISNPGGDTEAIPIYIVTNSFEVTDYTKIENNKCIVTVYIDCLYRIDEDKIRIVNSKVEQGLVIKKEGKNWKIYEPYDGIIIGKSRALNYFEKRNKVIYNKLIDLLS